MLELDFEQFMRYYEKARNTKGEGFRRLHYQETNEGIKLFVRSVDYWEYVTFVSYEMIESFGASYSVDRQDAIEHFKMNLLYNAMRLKAEEIVEEDDFEDEEEQKNIIKEPLHVEEEEAKDYTSFLKREFREWEKKILQYVDTELTEEFQKQPQEMMQKELMEFFRKVFNTITTLGFSVDLKRFIKEAYKEGIASAEKETNLDIGFKASFDNDIELFKDRQLEGFRLPNGKRWHGIKGTTREIQHKISEIVADGIRTKKGLTVIKTDIRDLMAKYKGGKVKGKVYEGRVVRIARTESARWIAASKQSAIKESGVKALKAWDALHDSHTSEICKRLEKKYKNNPIPLDEPFVDDVTGLSANIPPIHIQCRSAIRYVFK